MGNLAELRFKEFAIIAAANDDKKNKLIVKERDKGAYQPGQDFYKPLREAIVRSFKMQLGVSHVHQFATTYSGDETRKKHYIAVEKTLVEIADKLYVGEWFKPQRGDYLNAGVSIIVNPELGLTLGGIQTLVKLYFGQNELEDVRANYMTCLMRYCFPEYNCCVLDIRRKRFHFFDDRKMDVYIRSINNQMIHIKQIWDTD